jgi:hypothetical protein
MLFAHYGIKIKVIFKLQWFRRQGTITIRISPRFLCRLTALISCCCRSKTERDTYGNHRICLTGHMIGTFPRFVAIGFYFL